MLIFQAKLSGCHAPETAHLLSLFCRSSDAHIMVLMKMFVFPVPCTLLLLASSAKLLLFRVGTICFTSCTSVQTLTKNQLSSSVIHKQVALKSGLTIQAHFRFSFDLVSSFSRMITNVEVNTYSTQVVFHFISPRSSLICLSICLSGCLSVRLFVRVHAHPRVHAYVRVFFFEIFRR